MKVKKCNLQQKFPKCLELIENVLAFLQAAEPIAYLCYKKDTFMVSYFVS